MIPTILAGDKVRVVAQTRRPRIAEIWAFCDAGGTVTVHRYRRRTAAGDLSFRGDNVISHDAPVGADLLIGLVTHLKRGDRVVRFGIHTRFAWIVRRLTGRFRRLSGLRPSHRPP